MGSCSKAGTACDALLPPADLASPVSEKHILWSERIEYISKVSHDRSRAETLLSN
jgi:hypothetical protein